MASASAPTLALTFDDQYVDEWMVASGIMQHHGVCATFFVQGFPNIETPKLAKLHKLASAGHEIGFHSVSHANAVKFTSERTMEDYLATEIIPGLEAMKLFGFSPTAFAYPFNARNELLDAALSAHFKILRARAETLPEALHPHRGNHLLRAKSCDIALGDSRILRTVEDIAADLYSAASSGKALALYAHGVSDRAVRHHHMTLMGLDYLLTIARRLGYRFATASQLANDPQTELVP